MLSAEDHVRAAIERETRAWNEGNVELLLSVSDATISERAALSAPANAAMLPPPGTGSFEAVFFVKSTTLKFFRITSYNVCYTKLLRM